MRSGMRLERNAAQAPALDVSPCEVREPPTPIRDVPAVESARIVGDDEAGRLESEVAQHGEREISESAVGVVERDEQLAVPWFSFAAKHRRKRCV